jgi:tetratricopeptide (TPR) repeat protein
MEEIASSLLPRIPNTTFQEDKDKDKELKEYFTNRLGVVLLFGKYGQADAAFQANQHAKVVEVLDSIVDQVNAGKLPAIKVNPQLGGAILSLDLRSNIQLGKLDRAKAAVQAQQALAEGGDVLPTLRNLVGLIYRQVDELEKKKDAANLKKTVEGFDAILTDLDKKQKNRSPEYLLILAQCYGGMKQHKKAAELLDKIPAPKLADGMVLDEKNLPQEFKVYRGARLMLAQQLRQSKELDKAEEVLKEIMGTKEKQGWGAKNVDALKEQVYLHAAKENYGAGFSLASGLVKVLKTPAERDNRMKEHYLDMYYEMVLCRLRYSQRMTDNAKRQTAMTECAQLIVTLEKSHPNFGTEANAARMNDLIKSEPDLKAEYDKLRGN